MDDAWTDHGPVRTHWGARLRTIQELERQYVKLKQAVEKLERTKGFTHLDQTFGPGSSYSGTTRNSKSSQGSSGIHSLIMLRRFRNFIIFKRFHLKIHALLYSLF